MDSADVAEMLGLPSIKTVQTLAREGRIPARRLPGRRQYRFLRDEIVEWLRSDATRVMPDADLLHRMAGDTGIAAQQLRTDAQSNIREYLTANGLDALLAPLSL
ncbi:MAG: helix-turn-helix domain-containing protein [Acidimicrobiia bacterium]